MSLSRFAVQSPVKVTMIFVAVLVLGWISLPRLPTSLFPEVRTPRVTTTIRTVGLSPAEVERRICQPLERQLYTLRGVADVTTIARADSAVIITEFTWDTSLDFAFLDVKKVIADLQRQRATEIESTAVLQYDPNAAPVMVVGLVGDEHTPLAELRRLAENVLRPRFETLPGVANVVIGGGERREVRIDLDEVLLLRHNTSVQAVASALQQENVNATGGTITEGTQRYLLKAVGEFEEIEELERVVVARTQDAVVRLADVGRVSLAARDPKDIVIVDGREGVGLMFYRESRSNTVAVAASIRETLEAFAPGGKAGMGSMLPRGTKLVVASDQSDFIREALREVRRNVLQGAALAMLVLLIFLRDIRTTLIISIAMPVSIVATFNLMYFQGLTLNVMTLGGLALGTGMLVDNAIVVLENIFRLRQEGDNPHEAAHRGVRQVAGALLASTLTTIVVFLPVIYVEGVAGLVFREQALVVAYSLAASLFVALLLIPMLASRLLGRPPKLFETRAGESTLNARPTLYTRLLGLALRGRLVVVLAAVALMVLTVQLLRAIPQEFLPRTEQRQVGMRLVLPPGTPIESTRRVVEGILGETERVEQVIDVRFARIGETEGETSTRTEDPDGPNTAELILRVADWDRPTTEVLAAGLANFRSSDLVELLKPRLDAVEGMKTELKLQQGSILELLGSSSAPLMIEISGEDLPTLTLLAEQARVRLMEVQGLLNVRTNILDGAPEAILDLDTAQMAALGLDTQGVASMIRSRLEGSVAGTMKRDGEDTDLRVRVDYGEESLEVLRTMLIATPSGAVVPLQNIATFRVERGPREVVRRHQQRVARVMADLAPDVRLSEAIARADEALRPMHLPGGYLLDYTGEEQQRAEAFSRLRFALLLSILLVYMVMASIFESFAQPLLILLTIPLAGVGVVAGLMATGQTLNLMALIGVVMLGGIVVNNAIVLLDCVNQVRASHPGVSSRETLIAGCQRRLRPVLMTTLTTLLGLTPLALGIGQGAELRQSLAVAVLGGLASSALLTLFVIPVCQSYLDSVMGAVRRWRARHHLAEQDRALAPKPADK